MKGYGIGSARAAAGALAAGLAFAAHGVAAAPINIDFDGGDPPPGESFTWQGLDFSLDAQPGGEVNPAHRVVGDSDGAVDIYLEEPGKVSYKASLSQPAQGLQRVDVDWVYGSDLSTSTPVFSFIQPFLRTFDGSAPSTAVEGLGGSDQNNPNSPFTGVGARQADQTGGGFADTDFVNNNDLGAEAEFSAIVDGDGNLDTQVAIGGETASLALDLTPNDEVQPFYFEELLLQAGSFQDATSFQNRFGGTGQRFTYVDGSVTQVPLPGTLALLAAGLTGLAGLGLGRRR